MEIEVDCLDLDQDEHIEYVFKKITQCPICHKIGEFELLYACACGNTAYSVSFCNFCEKAFLTIYDYCDQVFQPICQFPEQFEETSIPPHVNQISAQFPIVYAQALQAESEGLDQIAGLGFRRSLEFLVKDYAILKNPDVEDVIKSMPMAQCIEKYIDHFRIKELAKRAAWLGNDYAHYLKKHSDRDLKDLKELISLTMQWINLEIESETYEREIKFKK